jgi:hypothetical protein
MEGRYIHSICAREKIEYIGRNGKEEAEATTEAEAEPITDSKYQPC